MLAELPQADGTAAYRDYVTNPIAMAMQDNSSAPSTGEVLPREQSAGPQDRVAQAEAAAAALIEAADKQRKAAGNPLNRVLSAVGGVIGAPINFLDAALGGGDMTQVTAPFRPQQNADLRFQQTVMGIQDSLAKIRENDAQMRASNASAVKTGLQTDREEKQAAYDALGQVSSAMLYMDPAARRQRLPALVAIARRYSNYPDVADAVQEVINNGYDDATLATYGSMAKEEGARSRANEYLYGSKQTSLGDGLGVTTYSRPNQAPNVYGPDAPLVSGLPAITSTPMPLGGSAPARSGVDFSKMTDQELEAFIAAQGGQ